VRFEYGFDWYRDQALGSAILFVDSQLELESPRGLYDDGTASVRVTFDTWRFQHKMGYGRSLEDVVIYDYKSHAYPVS
jgi:hypothetical protein